METLSSSRMEREREREREHDFSPSSSSDLSSYGETGAHRSNSNPSGGLSNLDLELRVHNKHSVDDNKVVATDCRICHLGLQEYGTAIQVGCCCKGDLAAAHKKCAETWFKIKGNMICEICGAAAANVAGQQQTNTAFNALAAAAASAPSPAPVILVEPRPAWHSRRIMNFLLASMIFAFVVSWLFHFKILP